MDQDVEELLCAVELLPGAVAWPALHHLPHSYVPHAFFTLTNNLNCLLNRRFVYEAPMPVGRLVRQVADKHQVCTQRSWKRPFGVGLLVGGYDRSGPHLYNTCPSGNYYEYKAMAIGARSQVGQLALTCVDRR